MASYLKAGELNPAHEPMQKGFLWLFSAWILDESLPWTTGEAPALHLLFKYLKIQFQLPSDTTVCNQLAHIFAELHRKVVEEFTVRMIFNLLDGPSRCRVAGTCPRKWPVPLGRTWEQWWRRLTTWLNITAVAGYWSVTQSVSQAVRDISTSPYRGTRNFCWLCWRCGGYRTSVQRLLMPLTLGQQGRWCIPLPALLAAL